MNCPSMRIRYENLDKAQRAYPHVIEGLQEEMNDLGEMCYVNCTYCNGVHIYPLEELAPYINLYETWKLPEGVFLLERRSGLPNVFTDDRLDVTEEEKGT